MLAVRFKWFPFVQRVNCSIREFFLNFFFHSFSSFILIWQTEFIFKFKWILQIIIYAFRLRFLVNSVKFSYNNCGNSNAIKWLPFEWYVLCTRFGYFTLSCLSIWCMISFLRTQLAGTWIGTRIKFNEKYLALNPSAYKRAVVFMLHYRIERFLWNAFRSLRHLYQDNSYLYT